MSESETGGRHGKAPPVKVEVHRQGAPVANVDTAYLHAGGGDCVAIYVDMHSKYCNVLTSGSVRGVPSVDIFAAEGARFLDNTKDAHEWTTLAFPEYKGWRVFGADIARYTLAVTLTKE